MAWMLIWEKGDLAWFLVTDLSCSGPTLDPLEGSFPHPQHLVSPACQPQVPKTLPATPKASPAFSRLHLWPQKDLKRVIL